MKARRAYTLVEMLVTLLVVGMILVATSGVFSQAARLSATQDLRSDAAAEQAAALAFVEARLRDIVLVGTPGRPSDAAFDVTPQSLAFVTRLAPETPRPGLHWIEIFMEQGSTHIRLSRWPEKDRPEDYRLFTGAMTFKPIGADAAARGLPLAVYAEAGPQARVLMLGAQIPLDCLMPVGDQTGRGGPLVCPGVSR